MYENILKAWRHLLLDPPVTNCHTFSDPPTDYTMCDLFKLFSD